MRAWPEKTAVPPPDDSSTWSEIARAAGGSLAASPGDVAPAGAAADLPPGAHRHGDVVHLEAHAHPHVTPPADGRPALGIVGAGAVGTALGVALAGAGWRVTAVASRDAGRRERFRALVPGARAFPDAAAILDECHLVILAVPDDAIAAVAASLRLYSGQAIVHTSGLHGAEALVGARAAGTAAGSFHPLVAFADLDRALAALPGATVAIEGDESLVPVLAEMAESIGAIPVRLAPGSKAAYHAAAVLAAGGLVALLDTIAELAARAGLDERGAMAVYGGLCAQALGNARALGLGPALTGPAVRGDAGTVVTHLAVIAAEAPGAADVYRALLRRQVEIAATHRGLSSADADRLRAALAARP
ncbi:MAG: DUF2520 domain-containing protein [Chloroflexi bacterium]|nr:DUF2520 domain-containing protein [Chloroflexota bacterium]